MLGVVGGGEFGRYFVLAARQMGYRVTVLDPDLHSPAGAVADVHLVAEFTDSTALHTLAETCAAVTIDFENPPVESLQFLAERTVMRPSPAAVVTCRDRILEKAFLKEIGANVVPYRVITTADDLAAAADLTYPAILKIARFGHDGTGQKRVMKHDDLAAAWDGLGNVPCVLEHRLTLDRELSMIVARSTNDRVATFPLAQNHLIEGVLDTVYAPAWMPEGAAEAAAQLAAYIARELDYVGVLCVDLFISGYDVYVNGLAPHPQNTGHYTVDFALTSQFEQQVRALCGQGLGDTTLSTPGAATVNLLGEMWEHGEPMWHGVFGNPSAHLHLYGNGEPRPGRRMGHLNVGADTALGATNLARRLRKLVKLDSPPA
jgi:5-(carboxyamino)imidazole ribonucleotide synthase